MRLITSEKRRRHGMYWKQGANISWWQYYQMVERVWLLFGRFPIWSKTLARADRPLHKFLRKVFN